LTLVLSAFHTAMWPSCQQLLHNSLPWSPVPKQSYPSDTGTHVGDQPRVPGCSDYPWLVEVAVHESSRGIQEWFDKQTPTMQRPARLVIGASRWVTPVRCLNSYARQSQSVSGYSHIEYNEPFPVRSGPRPVPDQPQPTGPAIRPQCEWIESSGTLSPKNKLPTRTGSRRQPFRLRPQTPPKMRTVGLR